MSPIDEIANWEIFLWSLYELGGSAQFVDVEDVFRGCYSLAPVRFKWRTQNLPDYKKCAKALQEAEARRPLLLVKTRDSYSRQLTVEGQNWIEKNSKRLSRILSGKMSVPEPRQRPTSRMMYEIERSEPFLLWKETGVIPNEKWRMAEVLHCSPDSSPATWGDRLEVARSVSHSVDKEAILRFLNEVYSSHTDWFGGKGNEDKA